METSPIPPEWEGIPKVMFIIDSKLTKLHDFEQYPISGVTKTRFITLIEKYLKSYYITPFVKCIPNSQTYSKKNINDCLQWLNYEIGLVDPKYIIGCGSTVNKYIHCDYTIYSPSKIIESAKNEQKFEKILKEIVNGC